MTGIVYVVSANGNLAGYLEGPGFFQSNQNNLLSKEP